MDNNQLNQKIELALSLQQQNQIDEAIKIFNQVLQAHPNQSDALHGLGLAFAQKKDFNNAVVHLKKAVEISPQVPGFHNNLGNAYRALGNINKAQSHYLQALRLKSPYSEAHNNLGSVYYIQGRISDAIDQFQKALRINPSLWDAHFNLGNCYIKQDRFLEAIPHFEETLKRRPDHLGAINNLGTTYCYIKQFDKAQTYLEQVIKREPNNTDALFHLGIAAASIGDLEKAKEYYLQVLSIDENHDKSHHNLATLYLHLDDKEHAKTHYEKAVNINPNNQTAKHMLKALSGEPLSEGAPHEYTRALFDQYAYSYDKHVKQKLHYQVPQLLRDLIKDIVLEKKEPWMVLDLGCGTGLCAPYFMDVADKLYGVDLSPKMIDVANQLGAYTKLAVSDIEDYLLKTKLSFHLIIAADVFVYFGELQNVFKLIQQRLHPNGYFLFSVEKPKQDTPEGFSLNETGRYAHQKDYVIKTLEDYGLTTLQSQEEAIRHQEDTPVIGNVFLVQNK